MAANRQVTDIKLLTTENRGVSAARNAGLRGLEKHEYAAFLDSDDIWPALELVDSVDELREAMEDPEGFLERVMAEMDGG